MWNARGLGEIFQWNHHTCPRGIGRVGPAVSRYTKGLTLDLHVRHVPSRVEVTARKVQGVANEQYT